MPGGRLGGRPGGGPGGNRIGTGPRIKGGRNIIGGRPGGRERESPYLGAYAGAVPWAEVHVACQEGGPAVGPVEALEAIAWARGLASRAVGTSSVVGRVVDLRRQVL